MKLNIYSLSAIFCLIFVFVVLSFVRQNKLKEHYALLWLLFGLMMAVTVLKIGNLHYLASFLGIINPPNLLFLLGLIFCFILILHLTVVVSKMEGRIVRLTQEIALEKQKENN